MTLEPSKEPSVGEEFCIGAAAGLLDCCCFHWLDTAKVRRQDGRPLLMDLQTGGPLSVARAGGPLEATCFVNADGSLALVVHNPSETAHEFRIVVDERGGLQSEIPAKSIHTYIIEDTKEDLCAAA